MPATGRRGSRTGPRSGAKRGPPAAAHPTQILVKEVCHEITQQRRGPSKEWFSRGQYFFVFLLYESYSCSPFHNGIFSFLKATSYLLPKFTFCLCFLFYCWSISPQPPYRDSLTTVMTSGSLYSYYIFPLAAISHSDMFLQITSLLARYLNYSAVPVTPLSQKNSLGNPHWKSLPECPWVI
jgi:hypothetical protein